MQVLIQEIGWQLRRKRFGPSEVYEGWIQMFSYWHSLT